MSYDLLDTCGLPDDILTQEFGLSVAVGGAGGGAGRIRRRFTVEYVVSAVGEDVRSHIMKCNTFTQENVSGAVLQIRIRDPVPF
jgi:hypothetical protein